jgi:pseudouridine-5'-phosphate glycosidase
MVAKLSPFLTLSTDLSQALELGLPVVALESAVITHGLPYPDNLNLARDLEAEVRSQGAVPATIAVQEGRLQVGLTADQLESLATARMTRKISRRDLAIAVSRWLTGGTTVAATLIIAHQAGIKVFATGGIGGVHRNAPFDISADLLELAHTPLVVVCSGAKAILDLPATLEVLETNGVPVIGYQSADFPAFYSRSSGLKVDMTVQTPQEVAQIASMHWQLGLESAVLVANPPPAAYALPWEQIENIIQQAVIEAEEQHITGAKVTPFLLKRVSELSGGMSLRANLALLRSNAQLAAQIALAFKGG